MKILARQRHFAHSHAAKTNSTIKKFQQGTGRECLEAHTLMLHCTYIHGPSPLLVTGHSAFCLSLPQVAGAKKFDIMAAEIYATRNLQQGHGQLVHISRV